MKIIAAFFIILIAFFVSMNRFFTLSDTNTTSAIPTHQLNNTIQLKFGHNTPVNSALHEAALKFADAIKKKTNGDVVITVYPAQELGNDHQMVELARDGEIDIILTPTAKMSVAVPAVQYADLPFYFPSRADLYEMLDGEPGQMILDKLKPIGLIGVTFWENGFKHFTANEPLTSVENFKDKKFRVMKSRIIMDQFKSFGAEPVAIDFYSTKQALHDKVVDGQENPLVAIVSMEFYKEQSDLTLSEHAYLGYLLSFSEKTFSKLPQDIQLLLIETAKEITPWERKETQKREAELLEIIKNAGVKIHTISPKERQNFANKTVHIPEQFEDVIGAHIISKTKELLYNKYGAHLNNEDHILLGVDTDLSSDSKVAGLEIKRGVELAVSELNAKGGVLGKHIEVIVKDHRAIASRGVQNIKEFAQNKHLAAVIGGVHGAVISAEIETIQTQHIPYLIPWSATAGLIKNGYKENYLFRVSANDRLAAPFIAKYATQKYKRPALIVENSIWGRSNIKLMKQYFKSHNIIDTIEIVYNRGQSSFEKEISQIVKSGADSIIMVANPVEGSHILQDLYNSDTLLPVISHWGITSGDFFKENQQVIKHLDLSIFQTYSLNNNNNLKAKQLLINYRKKYKPTNANILSSSGMAQAYDLVYLLAHAIEKAGTLQREKIKEALEHLPNYKGVIKNYTPAFSPKNHDALGGDDYYMAKYNTDGILLPINTNKE